MTREAKIKRQDARPWRVAGVAPTTPHHQTKHAGNDRTSGSAEF